MSTSPDHQPHRTAMVGSGVPGLTAAYASRHSSGTLVEELGVQTQVSEMSMSPRRPLVSRSPTPA